MGDWVKVKADDGHELGAYVATPAGEAIGAVVVVQEIFGVNAVMRGIADGFHDALRVFLRGLALQQSPAFANL